MKRKGRIRRELLAGIGGVMAGSMLFSGRAHAGTLEPPAGPITSTGRSLTDVEPRTPIESLPGAADALHVVTQGGAYKLTGNLTVAAGTVAIRIATSDAVSIDLGGFAIRGSGGGSGLSSAAIRVDAVPACVYVEIFDGYVQDVDGDGIDGGTASVLECYDLHIANAHNGIVVQGSLIVEGCHIERCSDNGVKWAKTSSADSFIFVVDDTECRACGGHGLTVQGDWSVGRAAISITDSDFVGNTLHGLHVDLQSGTPGGAGAHVSARIQAVRALANNAGVRFASRALGTGGSLVAQCHDVLCTGNVVVGFELRDSTADLCDVQCTGNGADGFLFERCEGSVECCAATRNGGDGLHLSGACRLSVSECATQSNGQVGIHLDSGVTHSAVQDNDVSNESVGIRVLNAGNLVVRNTALGGGLHYDLNQGTGAVVVSLGQLSSNSNPHANYSS